MTKIMGQEASASLVKVTVLVMLLLFGQWVALAHACTIDPTPAGKHSSATAEHQLPENGKLFCMATAVAGDELADAVLTPLAGDIPAAEFAPLARAPVVVSHHSVSTFHPPNPLGSRVLLLLFGRLRI